MANERDVALTNFLKAIEDASRSDDPAVRRLIIRQTYEASVKYIMDETFNELTGWAYRVEVSNNPKRREEIAEIARRISKLENES